MAAVSIREGISYGVSLLGYFIALALAGGLAMGIGFALFSLDSGVATLIGFIILLGGIVIFYAGSLGVGYKLIADGVARGIQSSADSAGGTGPSESGGGIMGSLTEVVEQDDQSGRRTETPPDTRSQE